MPKHPSLDAGCRIPAEAISIPVVFTASLQGPTRGNKARGNLKYFSIADAMVLLPGVLYCPLFLTTWCSSLPNFLYCQSNFFHCRSNDIYCPIFVYNLLLFRVLRALLWSRVIRLFRPHRDSVLRSDRILRGSIFHLVCYLPLAIPTFFYPLPHFFHCPNLPFATFRTFLKTLDFAYFHYYNVFNICWKEFL